MVRFVILHAILLLHGIDRSMISYGNWYGRVLNGIVLREIGHCCMIQHGIFPYCVVLHDIGSFLAWTRIVFPICSQIQKLHPWTSGQQGNFINYLTSQKIRKGLI